MRYAVEVFYYWQGSYADQAGSVSGVGLFEFQYQSAETAATGTGWFTTGDVEAADFSRSSKVHLKRVEPEEAAELEQGDARRKTLVQPRYETWRRAFDL